MKHKVYFTIFLLICFCVGLGARHILTPTETRAQAFMRLFGTHCLPLIEGKPLVPPQDMLRYTAMPGNPRWLTPQSHLTLEQSNRSCSISDGLRHLNSQERNELEQRAVSLVETSFPQLSLDRNTGLDSWAQHYFWMEHPFGHPDRWGIMLTRFTDSGEGTMTSLQVGLPMK